MKVLIPARIPSVSPPVILIVHRKQVEKVIVHSLAVARRHNAHALHLLKLLGYLPGDDVRNVLCDGHVDASHLVLVDFSRIDFDP